MLRSAATRWFEALCPRAESVPTLAVLAATGAVELEVRRIPDHPVRHLAGPLAAYQALALRYDRYWSRGRRHRHGLPEAPGAVLDRALERIAAWQRDADPVIERVQAAEAELAGLARLADALAAAGACGLDLRALLGAGPVLACLWTLVPAGAQPAVPEPVLARRLPWPAGRCDLLLGPREGLAAVRRQVQSVQGQVLEPPGWLPTDPDAALGEIAARRGSLSVALLHHYAELDGLCADFDLGRVLGAADAVAWFAERVGGLAPAGEHLDWITGWTDDLDGRRLEAALAQAQCPVLLRLAPPPPGLHPPRVLDHPAWLRPFEVFARALGVPGGEEVDPTPLLAVIVPLLFGYMFGDLGQGAVLALAGAWLARRAHPAGPLLVAGGLSAMGFGVLFGSVFAREDLLPALWLHPLTDPVAVLAAPLVFGVGLLSLGQLLAGLGAVRGGDGGGWLRRDCGLLVLYLGLATAAAGHAPAWLPWVGVAWYLLGSVRPGERLLGAPAALGRLLEGGLQLLVNTLSFARVGAFALAHAALAAAIVALAQAGPAWAAVPLLILGNGLIIALEGLVVAIQTTRLVLFEFFNRFLHGTGRVFRPLPAAPEAVAGR